MPTEHPISSRFPAAQAMNCPRRSTANGHLRDQRLDRCAQIASTSPACADQVSDFIELALRGLPQMQRDGAFGHTLRSVRTQDSSAERLEGDSLRYTAIVALGVACLPEDRQREVLDGKTAADIATVCVERAGSTQDLGAIALAAWAGAEAGGIHASHLFQRLAQHLAAKAPMETVTCAWTLTAALAAADLGNTEDVLVMAAEALVGGQSANGVFPHTLPPRANGLLRAHIGCFADQVYPIQALSRLHAARGDRRALGAAEACAARICDLQGAAGQWWWHYDTRNGEIVEGYPVYSVHQHAMGPMVLMDLAEAGGRDHSRSISRGLQWLQSRPELTKPLIDAEKGVIWRKVARREPGKAVRGLSALTTAAIPGLRLPGLDRLFPPGTIDHECRPYELGWLLYAWLSGGTVRSLSGAARGKATTEERPR